MAGRTRSARKRKAGTPARKPAPTPLTPPAASPHKVEDTVMESPLAAMKSPQAVPKTTPKKVPHSPQLSQKSEPSTSTKKRKSQTTAAAIIPKSPEPRPPSPQMQVNVHRCRHIHHIPQAILRLAATPRIQGQIQAPHLAISREGGSVELVSINEKWKCVAQVPGLKKRSVDAMAWVCGSEPATFSQGNNDMDVEELEASPTGDEYFCKEHCVVEDIQAKRRLFGASRDGTLFEIDFKSQRHLGVIGSGGGAVFCLVNLKGSNLVAAGCEDGSIRIFKASDTSGLELISTLPSCGSPVNSIAWKPNPNGGLSGSVLFAGVADGTIRRFDCVDNLQTSKLIGTTPHAMSTGDVLTHDFDSAHLRWKASLRITVETRGRRTSTKIWSLQVLNDGTLISGDSLGNVQFWDGHAGTLNQTIQHNDNNADVLDLAVNWDQSKVMASGVDSKVVAMERHIPGTGPQDRRNGNDALILPSASKWVLTNQQRAHSHDVTSLAIVYMTDPDGCAGSANSKEKNMCRELLCSGGLDTKVCSYFVRNMRNHRAKIAYKYPSVVPIALAREKRIMAVMRSDRVDLYQLGDKRPIPNTPGKGVALDEDRSLLGSIEITSISNLVCFHMSDDGNFIAMSDAMNLMIFSLQYLDGDNGQKIVVPERLNVQNSVNVPYSALQFSSGDSKLLVCGVADGPVNVVQIEKEEDSYMVSLNHTFNHHVQTSSRCNAPISDLTISPDNKWVAVGKNSLGRSSIEIFSLSPNYQHWWTIPCKEAPHSCIKFVRDIEVNPTLVVACNNCAFYLFDIERKCLSDWSRDVGIPVCPSLPNELCHRSQCPDRIAFNPATRSKFLMVSLVRLICSRQGLYCCTMLPHIAQVCHPCKIDVTSFRPSLNLPTHWWYRRRTHVFTVTFTLLT